MSSTIVIILVVIAVLVLALIAFLIVRRQRYIRSLRKRGWTFESKPALESVLDHHAPPFGLGFVRKVDEAISGTTAVRFSVDKHDTQLVGFCAEFAHEFLSRVPSFVWKNLQLTPPAFRRMPRAEAMST